MSQSIMPSDLSAWRHVLETIVAGSADTDGAHDPTHLRRVWANAQTLLAHHPQADPLVVMAGCYLHDLVNLPKNHPERAQASRRSAELARQRLAEHGFPTARLNAVAHAIEAHSFSAGIAPCTVEARIVQDSDRLDALGPVGLARLFYTAGRLDSALAHPDDPLGQQRPLDDRRYALDHIEQKLATLPQLMQTSAGRALAEDRVAEALQFRDAFVAQWQPGTSSA
ncbi:HD domain-containing protein [Neisseriaceae bacterium JH1-16]|nr:HD domain-containing protein [Neisseriaceae bacterium JH1-16]